MTIQRMMATAGLLCAVALTPFARAATPTDGLTRSQVKMERDEFLRTHRYDEYKDSWMLKDDVDPPAGIASRAEVKAERDAFLSTHRWDRPRGGWVPVGSERRNLSTMSRAEVASETKMFLHTHRWNDLDSKWEVVPARAKP